MIKKILLGIGISIVSFLGFSNAGHFQEVGITSEPSIYGSNYDLTFLKGGGLLSSFLGQGKSFLAFNQGTFFWWANNGQPYFYDNGNVQGFFGEYWLCDYFSGSDSSLTNCESYPITGDYKGIFKSFFNGVVAGELAYYNYVAARPSTSSYTSNTIEVCWSSSQFTTVLCFRQHYCYDGHGCSAGNYGSLVNSQNLSNLSFGSIPYSWIGYAPGQAGYDGGGNIEGSSNIGENTILSGNLVYNTCTNGYVISELERVGYNKNVCYAGITPSLPSGSLVGTGNLGTYIVGGTGLTLMELFQNTRGINGFNQYGDWINGWGNFMRRYKMGSVGVNPFVGQPVELYTYFTILYNEGAVASDVANPYEILNYCKLKVNSNLDNPYTGTYFKSYCDRLSSSVTPKPNITTGQVGTVDGSDEVLPPGYNVNDDNGNVTSSGTVISVDWSGVLSGDSNKNFDGKTFINDFYQKLQSNFSKPVNNVVGIIPSYILVFMFALILFRFLSH